MVIKTGPSSLTSPTGNRSGDQSEYYVKLVYFRTSTNRPKTGQIGPKSVKIGTESVLEID